VASTCELPEECVAVLLRAALGGAAGGEVGRYSVGSILEGNQKSREKGGGE